MNLKSEIFEIFYRDTFVWILLRMFFSFIGWDKNVTINFIVNSRKDNVSLSLPLSLGFVILGESTDRLIEWDRRVANSRAKESSTEKYILSLSLFLPIVRSLARFCLPINYAYNRRETE